MRNNNLNIEQNKEMLEDLEQLLISIEEEKNQRICNVKNYYKNEKMKVKKQIALIKRRIYWHNNNKYKQKDYSNTIAWEMFGKRLRDLTIEEKREYNKIRTRKSRELNKIIWLTA